MEGSQDIYRLGVDCRSKGEPEPDPEPEPEVQEAQETQETQEAQVAQESLIDSFPHATIS